MYGDSKIEQQIKSMKKFKEWILAGGKERARKFLLSTGIYTKDGELKEEYK
jgi:hypothetical protein